MSLYRVCTGSVWLSSYAGIIEHVKMFALLQNDLKVVSRQQLRYQISSHYSETESKLYYENTPIQIYWKFYPPKNENFQIKKSNIFLISAQNIDCVYSLESPRRGGSNEYHKLHRGGSNEYPQAMFSAEIRKIMYMYTPVNPSFTV